MEPRSLLYPPPGATLPKVNIAEFLCSLRNPAPACAFERFNPVNLFLGKAFLAADISAGVGHRDGLGAQMKAFFSRLGCNVARA